MRRTTWCLLLNLMFTFASAGLGGCRRDPEEEGHEPRGRDEHGHAEGDDHDEHRHAQGEAEGGEDLVRIDPEMLRDLRITTAKAELRASGEGVNALGELAVDERRYAEVGSPIEARLTRLLAGAGDDVRSGQALVELESVELGKARAATLGARARADRAARALGRKKALAEDQIAPRREVEEAESESREAEAELRAAQATLRALGLSEPSGETAEDLSARFVLRAPISGTVIARNAVLGRVAHASDTLLRIADTSSLWLTVHAFERDAVRVRTGVRVRVSLPALPGQTFTGTVALVGREVEAVSRTIPVRVELANEGGILRPGMSASAWLPVGDSAASVVSVPAASLQRMEDGWRVFIPRGPGLYEARAIGRGRDLGGEVEVLSGLVAGDVVVVEGAFLLKAEADKAHGEGQHHHH